MQKPTSAQEHLPQTSPWRAFGLQREDLDLDFTSLDRPTLVTAVLATCSRQAQDTDALWAQSMAERVGALVRIVTAAIGSDDIVLRLPCPACSEGLELDVPCKWLLNEAERGSCETEAEITLGESRTVRVRRPTGADQRNWRTRMYTDEEEAAIAIVHSLIVSSPVAQPALTDDDIQHIAEQMTAFDPLPALQIVTVCPACETEVTVPVDLEAHLLARLRECQHTLLAQVHRLAAAYGWHEDEVLAIPAHRRKEYLRLVEQEAGWP